MEIITKSEEETRKLAQAVLKEKIDKRSPKEACVFALSGDLGSGKTVFVKGLAEALSVKERILSPTFIIERRHKLDGDSGFSCFIHVDAYRLSSAEDLEVLGWKESIRSPENLVCVEWPERVFSAIPPSAVRIFLESLSGNERCVRY